MTTKLYNLSAYDKTFAAKVLSCTESENGYLVRLDRTLFFPEAGGQSCDTGTLSGVPVLDVQEREKEIYHTVKTPFSVGEEVKGEIDFALRYKKMQWHTAEHLLSGAVHALFGYQNVGFHLGDADMTVDFDGVLSEEELRRAEVLMNARIRANIPVRILYPTREEAEKLFYRSKMEIDEDLRLVMIGDADSCACCAPHVAYTGEIGMAYVTEFMRHKGGTRLRMVAGEEAFLLSRRDFDSVTSLSRLYSVPPERVSEAAHAADTENGRLRGVLASYERMAAASLLEACPLPADKEKTVCLFLPFASSFVLRDTAKALLSRGAENALVLVPHDAGGFSFVWFSSGEDLRPRLRDAIAALGGKGGGSPTGVQGVFTAEKDKILSFFGA